MIKQSCRERSSVGGGGGKFVSIIVCAESIKQKKENVPNINWPTTLVLGEGKTHAAPNFSWGGCPQPPPLFLRPLLKEY